MKKPVIVLLAVASIALAACDDTSDDTASPKASVTVSAVPASLGFTATTVDGKPFDAATLAGKPAVLWFWAAWCPDCRADAPKVRELQQQYAGKVAIVGVGGLASGATAMNKFVADYNLSTFPQLADDTGSVWKRFLVPSQRYYVLLNKAGQVIYSGPLTPAQLGQKLDGLS